ncbi:MAG: lysozyme [Clostridium sp.]|nr:lysozyme [Clostridium sp.]
MDLSESIKKKIKAWEGCSLQAYKCPSGVLTIGFGHTGSDVKPGMRISQAEADALFEADIARFAASMEPQLARLGLRQCQADALVSLSYNIGSLEKKAPSLLAKVKADPDDPAILLEFMRHVNARVNGKLVPLAGLVRRREAEANHYYGRV